MSIRHAGVKDGLTLACPQVERRQGLLRALNRGVRANHKWGYGAIVVKAQVGELRRGVRKNSGVNLHAALSG